MPDSYDGQRMRVQAGPRDDALNTNIKLHIFCGSRADWERGSADAGHFDETPDCRVVADAGGSKKNESPIA
jgi:hypothetical protein